MRRYWLIQFRLDKKLTQVNVADHVGISIRYYQMIEQGRKTPSVEVAKQIAEFIDFEWGLFFI